MMFPSYLTLLEGNDIMKIKDLMGYQWETPGTYTQLSSRIG